MELRMLCKRMNKTFLFLLWNFMHFKLCFHVTKTELIIGHSGPRVGSCVTLWAHWQTPDRCLRRTRRFIDGTVRISSWVRRVHPRTSGPKRGTNSSPRTPMRITASQPPAPTTRCLIPWVRCPQSRCVIPVYSSYTLIFSSLL